MRKVILFALLLIPFAAAAQTGPIPEFLHIRLLSRKDPRSRFHEPISGHYPLLYGYGLRPRDNDPRNNCRGRFSMSDLARLATVGDFTARQRASGGSNKPRNHKRQKANLNARLILRAGYEDVKESGSLSCETDLGVNPLRL